jgi:hypothetical protein
VAEKLPSQEEAINAIGSIVKESTKRVGELLAQQKPDLAESTLTSIDPTGVAGKLLDRVDFGELSRPISTAINSNDNTLLAQAWGQFKAFDPDFSLSGSIATRVREQPYLLEPVAQLSLIALAASYMTSMGKPERDDPVYTTNGRYNPIDAEEYYAQRPVKFLARTAQIFGSAAGFGLKLLSDYREGKLYDFERECQRADELSITLTELGPTFIKIGQSLSVRTDLLRPAYVLGLTKLQDRVPAFPTNLAKSIIKRELGIRSVEEAFSGLEKDDTKVVAAASLGQVYKLRTKAGETVAVKVQRPGIMNSISLDLHIIRSVTPFLKKYFNLKSDLLEIIDQLGAGFVDELDYRKEAANADTFMEAIEDTPLSGVVFAPEVLHASSTRKVLTTRWVDGDRLEESPTEEISKMCSLAMNTYLTMMLQCPILHADPRKCHQCLGVFPFVLYICIFRKTALEMM